MSALFRHPVAAVPAPTGRTINALLQFADVTEDLGDGRTRLRLSAKRARSADVKAALGAEAKRAAELAVVYDEREAEVVEIACFLSEADAEAEAWMAEFDRRFEEALTLQSTGFWNSPAHKRQRRKPARLGAWG